MLLYSAMMGVGWCCLPCRCGGGRAGERTVGDVNQQGEKREEPPHRQMVAQQIYAHAFRSEERGLVTRS
ncbi:MAG: hypothetical protein H7836_01085 [Magnetococcus sp. YQC-3]